MTTANQSAAERNITLVSVANIQPSNYNPRKRFDETGLDELAESIKQQGVLQPITVRPIADTDRYEIVFGERRYRASVIAGFVEAVTLQVYGEFLFDKLCYLLGFSASPTGIVLDAFFEIFLHPHSRTCRIAGCRCYHH